MELEVFFSSGNATLYVALSICRSVFLCVSRCHVQTISLELLIVTLHWACFTNSDFTNVNQDNNHACFYLLLDAHFAL